MRHVSSAGGVTPEREIEMQESEEGVREAPKVAPRLTALAEATTAHLMGHLTTEALDRLRQDDLLAMADDLTAAIVRIMAPAFPVEG